ncbi:hypothetical protein LINPERHAP2_LOCUS470 [Linum perenne]
MNSWTANILEIWRSNGAQQHTEWFNMPHPTFLTCVVSRILGSTDGLLMRVCAKNKEVKTVVFCYLLGLRYGKERWRTTCFVSGRIKTIV